MADQNEGYVDRGGKRGHTALCHECYLPVLMDKQAEHESLSLELHINPLRCWGTDVTVLRFQPVLGGGGEAGAFSKIRNKWKAEGGGGSDPSAILM